MLLALAIRLALLQAPGPAHGIELEWAAPEECPDVVAVTDHVERYLGQPIEAVPSQDVKAVGEIETLGHGFLLRLTIDVSEGTAVTSVEGPDCGPLTELAALKIAMAIDPFGVLEYVDQDPPVSDPAPAPSPPVRVTSTERIDNPRLAAPTTPGTDDETAKIGGALRAITAISSGLLPGFGASVGGLVALRTSALRIDVGMSHVFERPTPSLSSTPGARLRATLALVQGCGVPRWRALEFPLCVGVQAGSVRGRGADIGQPKTDRRAWVGFSVHPQLAWAPIRHVALVIGPELVVAALRPSFQIGGVGQVHRSAAVVLRGNVGLEVRFP
ncbi:MAG: hypothetical protein JKY37_33760 [Nannocystaceae bacterium]|nr:hypothetical protein [Nannocystaceae bacterium]